MLGNPGVEIKQILAPVFLPENKKLQVTMKFFTKIGEKQESHILWDIRKTYRRKMEENAAYPSKHEKTDKSTAQKGVYEIWKKQVKRQMPKMLVNFIIHCFFV